MQLNLFDTLNSFCQQSMKSNHSLAALNSNLAMGLLESQVALAQTTLSKSSLILMAHGSPEEKLSRTGELANGLLEASQTSIETTMDCLNKARPNYEQWAIASAGVLGEMMSSMTGLKHH